MDTQNLQKAINDVVATYIQTIEPSIVTKFVLLVETMDSDGVRGLWSFTQDGAKAWDTLGMLHFAIQMEQAKTAIEGG